MELLAGEAGMETSIKWVHSIEDKGVAEFLHGNELVLTTCIANKGEEWILDFVIELFRKRACGILINVGPYIKKVPDSVINFCKKHDFPLIIVPWEIHLVDITRDISSMILSQEKEQITLINCMKDAIFYPEEVSSYCNPLKRHGYLIQKNFCPVLMEIKGRRLDEIEDSFILELLQYILTFRFGKSVFFSLSKYYVLILYRGSHKDIEDCVDLIQKFKESNEEFQISNIIVGPNIADIKNLHQSYQIACKMSGLAKRTQKYILNFYEIGTYQLLLNVQNIDLAHEFFQKKLGLLKEYDKENGTELFYLFRIYLETDCSVKKTAQLNFCHRNTINQKVHKVREILEIEQFDIQQKIELLMAYKIYDLML